MEVSRTPPQDVEIEKKIIGAMLQDNKCVPEVLELLVTQDFYNQHNQRYFQSIQRMFNEGIPVDSITLIEDLKKSGSYSSEDAPRLIEIGSGVSTTANVKYHSHIVKEKAVKRSLIYVGTEIASKAFVDTEDALDLLEQAQVSLYKIGDGTFTKSANHIGGILQSVLEKVSQHDPKSSIVGLDWGIESINEPTLGAISTDLIIVAGRPSMGKTSFVLDRAIDMAQRDTILFFSQEMDEKQLGVKVLASAANVDMNRLRLNRLSVQEAQRVYDVAKRLNKAKLYIDDTSALSLVELRAKCIKMKNDKGLGAVVVDYLQNMAMPNTKDSTNDKIGILTKGCKRIAKDLKIPFILLSQLNRNVENRTDKRPTLADLRSSGEIEQDADVVMFVHRPEKYGETSYKINDDTYTDMDGFTSLIIAKNRNNYLAEIPLRFNKSIGGSFVPYNNYLPQDIPHRKDEIF